MQYIIDKINPSLNILIRDQNILFFDVILIFIIAQMQECV